MAVARKAAEESIVLLKNEGNILPLKKDAKVSLVGTLAWMPEEIIGAWAMGWEKKDCVSILEGMKQSGGNVRYYPCGGPEGAIQEEETRQAAQEGDIIVAVVGELVNMTGEASSKTNIELPGEQRKMLQILLDSGKPVVTVLMNGRPLALGWEEKHLPVLLEAWHLGIQMGTAVSDVLYGKINPSGKLASSFPAVNGQCPIYYNHMNTGRPASGSKFTSKYMDAPCEAVFPFGYGLSYTTFGYSDFQVQETEDAVELAVTLKNTGNRAVTEVVQFYLQDVTASLVRPVKELKGYERVTLEAGEERRISYWLSKDAMGFYNNDADYVKEDGLYRFYAGGSSRDVLCAEMAVRF